MSRPESGFRAAARAALADPRLGRAIESATGRFRHAREAALAELPGADALRDHFKRIRRATLADLDAHLERFTSAATAAGAQVHFAEKAADAREIVLRIAREHGARLAAKSKSMVTEEIHLNQALEAAGVQPVETDLGEWIVQLAGEGPSHIIAPAIHKTKEQVAHLFSQESGSVVPADIPTLTTYARGRLRERFLAAGIGISGGNIAVAESGSIVLVTNEGNGRMVTSLPPVHIAVIGIEKVAPTWREAGVWLALLARSATGQPLSIYTSVITGPRRPGDPDGPEEVHIVLLDNGRRRLRGTKYEEVLQCIRCGACLNVCPVYRVAGGHAYRGAQAPASPYSGPIGAVVSPLLFGMEAYGGLPQASSLCGACLDVCPARIDLPRMLVELRTDLVEEGRMPAAEAAAEVLAARVFEDERLLEAASRLARLGQPLLGRGLPRPARRSFRSWWKANGRMDAGEVLRPESGPGSGAAPDIEEKAPAKPAGDDGLPSPGPWESRRRFDDPLERFRQAQEKVRGEVLTADSQTAALEKLAALLQELGVEEVALTDESVLAGFRADRIRLQRPSDFEGDPAGWRAACARAGAGITGAEALLAETGTLIVESGQGKGRLASLLPPVHIAVAPLARLETDLFTWLAGRNGAWPANCVLISGPSKTADIEQTMSVGVHGPRRLVSIVFKGKISLPPDAHLSS